VRMSRYNLKHIFPDFPLFGQSAEGFVTLDRSVNSERISPMQAKSTRKLGGYYRTDLLHSALRSQATAENRMNRLKQSVNLACEAFFRRRGMTENAIFNHWPKSPKECEK
jgi:hypothetical protein